MEQLTTFTELAAICSVLATLMLLAIRTLQDKHLPSAWMLDAVTEWLLRRAIILSGVFIGLHFLLLGLQWFFAG